MTLLELECGPSPLEAAQGQSLEDRALAAFIIQLVALCTGVAAREIAAASRCRTEVSRARQIAMYLAHTGCSWSLARVGFAFGRDRSTASHACQRVEDLRDDPHIDALIDACEACVRSVPRRPVQR